MALAVKKLKLRYSSPKAFFNQYQSEIVNSRLFAPTSTPPPVNTPVLLTLIIPDVPEPFVVQCRVASSVDKKRAETTGRKMGMTLHFNSGQWETIRRLEGNLKRSKTYSEMLGFSSSDKAGADTVKHEAIHLPQGETQFLDRLQSADTPLAPTQQSETEIRGRSRISTAYERELIKRAQEAGLPSTLTGDRIERLKRLIRDRDTVKKIEKKEPESTVPLPAPMADRVKKEFSSQERGRMEPVVAFILDLVKAMLRSGYYAPDHPGSRDAKEGIYNEFQAAVGERPDLTLLNQESKERSDVLISGILEDQVSLRGLIGSEQASIFIPKFKEYFNRKSLVSFSMKKTLTLNEFNNFIDIMSDPAVDKGESGEVGSLLTNALVEKEVTEVSTVFMDDMIILELKLPWRVEMAIQRLAKDLKVLPMFRGKSEEEIQAMKIRIVQDIVRPLREPHMLKDIVVNCHVIAKHVAVIEAEDLEQIIVKSFPMQILLPTSKYVFEELTKISEELKEKPGHPALLARMEGVKRILKWVSQRVVLEGIEGSERFFEQLYFYSILKFEELPEAVKDHVNTLTLVKEFRENPSFYMEKFYEAVTEDDVLLLVRLFRRILPDLLEQEEYDLISLITKSVEAKFELYPRLRKSTFLPLQEPIKFIWEDSIDSLEEKFRDEKSGSRAQIENTIELLGTYGVHLLVQTLMDSKDKTVRSSAVNTLIKMGDFAINEIVGILKNPSNPWYLYRNALAVMSKIGGGGQIDLISGFLRHSKPRVREEAVNTISTLQGPAAEPTLLRALRDPNIRVRRRAVECIGKFSLKSQRVLIELLNILNIDESTVKNVVDKNQILEFKAEAINTLSLIGNVHISTEKRVEDILLDLITPDKKWLDKLSNKVRSAGKKGEDQIVQNAVLKALWKIGTKKSLPSLTTLAERGDRALASKAKEVIAQIKLRDRG
ncbi:MAG: HEAT repeat domain-containing protein [Deltaproteobacteria bacterium]|uniref:HEAT repeat domain-containing protein n=1 Tax=Candidatus Zymogenus saltonus TaxID=2844893 RepID=A0A9D8KH30_9DELT|nr:HEAT repeat domain-containing protein [Candidatus Zymogenus saltonus]